MSDKIRLDDVWTWDGMAWNSADCPPTERCPPRVVFAAVRGPNASLEIIMHVEGGKVFVGGEETTDSDRIGAAFKEWARLHHEGEACAQRVERREV